MDNYLDLLVIILPIIAVALFFALLNAKKQKASSENIDKDVRILKFPTSYIMAPLFAFGMCVLLIFYIVFCAIEEWPYAILASVTAIPWLLMVILWSLWRVEIRDEEFAYRNWFGKTKVYRYEDVEFRWHDKGSKWYFYKGDKKVFCMPYYIEDGERLERRWKKVVKKSKENKD